MTASGTGVSLGIIAETSRGFLNGASGNLVELPTISRNLNLKKDLLESQAVTASRQRVDVRHGFNRVEGELGVELRMATYDNLLIAALGGSAWGTPPTANAGSATTIALTATGTPTGSLCELTRASGNWIDAGYRQGDWVTLSGFSNAANNGTFRVTFVAAGGLIMGLAADGKTTFVNAAAAGGNVVTYFGAASGGAKATIGTLLQGFTIERRFDKVDNAELVNVYNLFVGCAVNTLTISARPESLVTATFGILGMSANIDQLTSWDTNSTYAAAPVHSNGLGSPPFASIDAAVYIEGFQANVTAFDVTIDNQRSLLGLVGRRTSVDIYDGTAKVTGTMSILLANNTHVGKFEAETSYNQVTLTCRELGSDQFLSISFYNVKVTSVDIDPPQNGAVIQTIAFEALQQSFVGGGGSPVTYREVMHIQRSGI